MVGRIFRSLLWIILLLLLVAAAGVFLFVGAYARTSLLPPFTWVGTEYVGLMSREDAKNLLAEKYSSYSSTPRMFVFEGEAKQLSLSDIGVSFNAEDTLTRIPSVRSQHTYTLFLDTFTPRRVEPAYSYAPGQVEQVLEDAFAQMELAQDAYLRYDEKSRSVAVEPERTGLIFDRNALFAELEKTFNVFSEDPMFIASVFMQPTVTGAELEQNKDTLLANLPKTLSLKADKNEWKMSFPKDIEYVRFQKPNVVSENAPELIPVFPQKNLSRFLEAQEIPKEIENAPEGLKIESGEDGNVAFEGRGLPGHTIDRAALRYRIEQALQQNLDEVDIPVLSIEPTLEISEDLQRLGIKELVGRGYSTFYGSPNNRIHNIGVGVKRFDGVIIAPGDVFSFNTHLGPVEAYTGYLPELVIKPEGTIPEYGGGLCQVSTTMYRAALYSGLPIVERNPHSYAVTYYSQTGGHGLDATIYPGASDLKFKNDTPGSILVHSYVDGKEAYFDFYGTSDGREVSFEGPYISNKKSPGADQIVYTTALPAGQRKQQQKPVAGFDALWYRYLTKNGETVKEEIFSRYKAIPAKFAVGGEGEVATDPAVEAAKQFE